MNAEMEEWAGRVVARAREKGALLACAESCTGGLVAGAVTSVPGASDVFPGGVVSYAARVKESVLGVPREVLGSRGAVSAECAEAMAGGVRRLMGADLAVSLTGIAGPGGGSPGKPVGLVWFGLALPGGVRSESRVFPGGRAAVREQAVLFALGLLLQALDAWEEGSEGRRRRGKPSRDSMKKPHGGGRTADKKKEREDG